MSKFFIHLVWMCPIFTWTQSNHGLQEQHHSKNLVSLLSHLNTCKGSNLKALMIENSGLILLKKYTQPVTRCCFTDKNTLCCHEEGLASFANTLCFPVTWMLYLQKTMYSTGARDLPTLPFGNYLLLGDSNKAWTERKKAHINSFWPRQNYSMLQANLSTSYNLFPNPNPDEFKICLQKFTTCFINLFYKNYCALLFFPQIVVVRSGPQAKQQMLGFPCRRQLPKIQKIPSY